MKYSEQAQLDREHYGKLIAKNGIKKFEKLFPHAVPTCIKYKVIAKVCTSGSCHLQGTPNARATFGVFWGDGHPKNFCEKVYGIQEKNRAELLAALIAIGQAIGNGYYAIKIQTESEFVKMVIDKKLNLEKPDYRNYHDLKYILDLLTRHIEVFVEHVKSHSGHHGNEQAGRLAKIAMYPDEEDVDEKAGKVGKINLNSREETQSGNTEKTSFLSLKNRRNTIDFAMKYSEKIQWYRQHYGVLVLIFGIKEFEELFPDEIATCVKYKVIAKVYTDGSCHLQGTPNARAGFGVFWGDGHPNNFSGKVDGIQENNRAELAAAEHAIWQAMRDGYSGVKIQTDSEFVRMVIDRTLDIRKPAYRNYHDLADLIEEWRKQIAICVEHVKSHSGHHGNEEADRLAKIATYPDEDDVDELAGSVGRIHLNKTHKRRAQLKRAKARKEEARLRKEMGCSLRKIPQ
ncbi:hypothetical protein CAEBREN_26064 [Caenorhabditis brenneri]|uniref:ribonuclease H n=1 Tax=Caenorhabditis brenneri TaxID=135651 RepID=G0P1M9_CAEBE|nr:hypothetical protein CAEBREN_26064 [Caenorhabditis brenneri]